MRTPRKRHANREMGVPGKGHTVEPSKFGGPEGTMYRAPTNWRCVVSGKIR
jgi:hypothetical protein